MLKKQKITTYDIICDKCGYSITEEILEGLGYKPIYTKRKQIFREFRNMDWKRKKGKHLCIGCLKK